MRAAAIIKRREGNGYRLFLTLHNPPLMETIFWIAVGLLVVAGIAVAHTVRQHNKMFKEGEDPVPFDDGPGHYDEYELSERPFIEYFN